MPLKISDAGLYLESSAETMAGLPLQAFAVTLSDSIIENLIDCVQNGQDVQLSLGNTPAFLYGSNVHRLANTDPLPLDLYLTDPSESSRVADRLPNPTMSLFHRPDPRSAQYKRKMANMGSTRKERIAAALATSERRMPKGLDADIEALQSSLAQANAEKLGNSTKVINAQLPSKRGAVKGSKGKLLPSGKGALASAITRSQPASPALSGIGSPSLAPTLSASQQVAEKAKEQRSSIVHELAVREQSFEELREKWLGDSDQEFKTALDKVADFDNGLQKYVMKKMYWKELDVFKYPYENSEERQQAIDNAIKQFDRMRLGQSEPEWQKLLPKEERGKGKCLSKLQATIARGPPQPAVRTPKITVHEAEESNSGSAKNGDDDLLSSDYRKKAFGGEPMARSSSQPLPPKKKISEREAQAKRLLSNSKKPNTPKVSPTKATGSATKGASKDGKEKRILSKEFISDSDSSSSEEAPLSTTVPKSRPAPPPVPMERPKEKEVHVRPPTQKPKAVVREPVRVQAAAKTSKRTRDDDDSSSSSGTPLSKRFKTRPEIKAVPLPQPHKHRTSDASQNSRGTSSSHSYTERNNNNLNKSKNTSPAKSSPLASSPPTNASDLDNNYLEADTAAQPKKRKALAAHEAGDARAKQQRLMDDAVELSRKFKAYYRRYETEHYEIVGMEEPPRERITDLLDMRQRLENMKKDIQKKISLAHQPGRDGVQPWSIKA